MTAGQETAADGSPFFVLRLRIVAPTANCCPATGLGGRITSPLALSETRETHVPFRFTIPLGTFVCTPRRFGQRSARGGIGAVVAGGLVVVVGACGTVVVVATTVVVVVEVAVTTADVDVVGGSVVVAGGSVVVAGGAVVVVDVGGAVVVVDVGGSVVVVLAVVAVLVEPSVVVWLPVVLLELGSVPVSAASARGTWTSPASDAAADQPAPTRSAEAARAATQAALLLTAEVAGEEVSDPARAAVVAGRALLPPASSSRAAGLRRRCCRGRLQAPGPGVRHSRA